MNEESSLKPHTKMLVHDKYLVSLWDSDSKRVSGKRITAGLFSVESFKANKKEQFQVARMLADKVVPYLRELILANEELLRRTLETVTAELVTLENDPLYANIALAEDIQEQYEIIIDQHGAWPLLNLFIRSIVLVDMIIMGLKKIYAKGLFDYKHYKRREKVLIKPMWQTMVLIEDIIKKFHVNRKEILNLTLVVKND